MADNPIPDEAATRALDAWHACHGNARAKMTAALEAARPYLIRQQWMPIETAPKDRSFIWLAAPGSQRIGYWNGDGWGDLCRAESGGQRGLLFAPTLWQPLPSPPET